MDINSKYKEFNKYLINIKIRQFLRTYFNELIILVLFVLGFLLLFTIPVMLFRVSAAAIKTVAYLFAVSCIAWFVYKVYVINKKAYLNLSTINSRIEEGFPLIEDRLVNTWSLWKDKLRYKSIVAEHVINGLLNETLAIIKQVPAGVLPLKVLYRHLVLLCAVSLLLTALFYIKPPAFINAVFHIKKSMLEEYNNYLEVLPGDACVASGSNLTINVLTGSMNVPEIEIFRLDRRYKEDLKYNTEDRYEYKVTDIREKFKYRILAYKGGLKSKWYKVNVKLPPVVREITLTYIYPAYTGFNNRKSTDAWIEGLRGTTVIIEAKSSEVLGGAVLHSDKHESRMTLESPDTAEGSLVLENQTFYQVVLEDADGLKDSDSPRYPVRVLNDEPPEVELITPVADLEVSPEANVEISAAASDDVGLKNVYIVYHIDIGGSTKRVPVKTLSEPVKSDRFSYIWEIYKTDVIPGNIITYQVAVEDINTLYGPGTGYSREMRLEILGFRDRHDEILRNIKKTEEEVFAMLSDSYEITSRLEQSDFKESLKKTDLIQDRARALQKFISQLLVDMESDPYMEQVTIDEYSGLKKNLDYLNKKTIPQLKASAEKSLQKDALERSRELSSHLERMMKLSEDITKRERMSDVLSSASDSLEKARELSDMLNRKDITPKDIQKKLEKIDHLLNELRKAIKDFPHDLPDEFINRESVKNLDFAGAEQGLSDLQRALVQGDFETAKEMLNRMIESLQGMMETLQEAAGGLHSQRRDKLLERTNQLNDELKSIIVKQEELIKDTRKINDFVRIERNIYEKKRFKELKSKYYILKSTTRLRSTEIDKEFSKGYLYKTQEILEKFTADFKQEWKKDKIKEFLKELRKIPSDEKFLDEEQKLQLNSMSDNQEDLKKDVSNLREGISTLGHHTALLDMELLENLDLAGMYMGYAQRNLTGMAPSDALPWERQALSYLIQTGDKMKSLSQKLQAIPQSLSAGGAQRQYQHVPSGSASGRTGFREGYVEIPGPGQAEGGKEFRRMILEALKEEHPEEYKKLIREYFRSLSD